MIFDGWIGRPIGGQVSDHDARDRLRRRHHQPAEPTPPNPDFDFGPPLSPAEVARPDSTDRTVSKLMLVLFILVLALLMPLAVLLLNSP